MLSLVVIGPQIREKHGEGGHLYFTKINFTKIHKIKYILPVYQNT